MENEEKQKKWVNRLYIMSENEAWLEAMAKKGLLLTHFDHDYAYFQTAQPEDINYKIVILNPQKAEDQIKIIERQGFTFLGSSKEFYVFSMTGKYKHIQPRMNEEMISFAVKRLNKQMVKSVGINIAVLIPLFVVFVIVRDKFLLTIAGLSLIWSALIGFALILAVLESIRDGIIIQRMKRSLLSKDGYQSNFSMKKHAAKRVAAWCLVAFTTLLPLANIFIEPKQYSIYEIQKTMPIVLIQNIQQDSEQTAAISEAQRTADELNYAEIKRTLLAPRQYQARQNSDGGHMNIFYLEVVSAKLAEPMAKELLLNDFEDIGKEDIVKIDYAGLDAAYGWKQNDIINVSACKGKRVMSIFYIGDAETEELLKAMAEVL